MSVLFKMLESGMSEFTDLRYTLELNKSLTKNEKRIIKFRIKQISKTNRKIAAALIEEGHNVEAVKLCLNNGLQKARQLIKLDKDLADLI